MVVLKEEFVAICEVTFDANLPANSSKVVNITIDPTIGAKTEHPVPSDRDWIITDIYVTGSQSVDAIVQIIKNGEKVETQTDPINTLLVSNPSRPRIPVTKFEAGSRLSMKAINLAAIGTAAVTDKFYAKIKQVSKGAAKGGLFERLKSISI